MAVPSFGWIGRRSLECKPLRGATGLLYPILPQDSETAWVFGFLCTKNRHIAVVVASVAAPAPVVEEPKAEEAKVAEEAPAEPAPEVDAYSRKIEEKTRKFLLGKKASRRIETDNGVLVVDEGGEITEEVLQKAKLAGKYVELSMNVQ